MPVLLWGLRIVARTVRSPPSGVALSFAVNRRARRFDRRPEVRFTPVTREDVSPGEHAIVLTHNGAEIRQTVRVKPGSTFSMIASMKAATPVSGWIVIKSPVAVSVFEGGALVGTSLNPKIMLAEGAHTLELINEDLGYREEQSVPVDAERS